jgi:cation transport ATPase
MSLWLQVLCWSGIFGFAAFMVFVVFLVKRSLGFIRSNYNKELRYKALALFTGIVVAFLLGGVYSIWTDEKVLYLFWACVGMLMSYVRLGKRQENIRLGDFRHGQTEKDVELIFYD